MRKKPLNEEYEWIKTITEWGKNELMNEKQEIGKQITESENKKERKWIQSKKENKWMKRWNKK